MKNKICYIYIFIFISSFFISKAYSVEDFSFDVTEIEVLEKGNIVKGLKKGTIKTNDGITINSDTFTYDKKKISLLQMVMLKF